MTTNTQTNAQWTQWQNAGVKLPFDQINEPGCYICNWSGHLLRVPEDGIAPGRSPLINFVGREPLYVTKLSDNPYIPVTKARMYASNWDVAVNF